MGNEIRFTVSADHKTNCSSIKAAKTPRAYLFWAIKTEAAMGNAVPIKSAEHTHHSQRKTNLISEGRCGSTNSRPLPRTKANAKGNEGNTVTGNSADRTDKSQGQKPEATRRNAVTGISADHTDQHRGLSDG